MFSVTMTMSVSLGDLKEQIRDTSPWRKSIRMVARIENDLMGDNQTINQK